MRNILLLGLGALPALSQPSPAPAPSPAAPSPTPPAPHDGHAGHGHGGAHAFEWAGTFETPENTYLWTAQKTGEDAEADYVDPNMFIVILPANDATDATLHSLEDQGSDLMGDGSTCTDVIAGEVITPRADRCYNLLFKADWWQSLYSIDTTGLDAIAIFAQHFPTEFENTAHYLKDSKGVDIEPVAELPEATESPAAEDDDVPWGPAIGASVIVNLVTLTGVILAIPVVAKAAKDYAVQFECLASGFAAGAISACAFFLLLFEATHLIAVDHKEEVEVIWRWGTMILAGATFPAFMHLAIEQFVGAQVEATAEEKETSKIQPSGARIIAGILLGDFIHNLCDGFFVGGAFKLCGESFGWTVASGTIAHEIAQELSDYVILTGPDCKLNPLVALILNFLSGTGVLLGAIIVLSSDVGDGDIGLLLAFGGGTYLYIAFVECMPKVMSAKVSVPVRALAIFVFMLGAIAIGLVLLDHEHCIPPAPPGEEPAGGHGHGHDH